MDRRTFIKSAGLVSAWLGISVFLQACGDDDPAAPVNGNGDVAGSISANHGHSVVITAAQITAGNAVTLTLSGGGHLSRSRVEALLLAACSEVMLGLSRLASDLLLFSTREFGLIALPPSLCTGSSLMPQKRNPDVLELIRARFHVVAGEEAKVRAMTAGLMSSYNRDVQLTKGPLFAGVAATVDSLRAMAMELAGLKIDVDRGAAAVTDEMRATEGAMKLVSEGVPFRDAYRRVAAEEAARREARPEVRGD